MRPLLLLTPGGAMLRVRSRLSIGRSPGAGLFVNGTGVAAAHAWIEPGPGGWLVRAAQGAVVLNGEDVDAAPLCKGDRLAIGSVELRVGPAPGRRLTAGKRIGAALVVALGLVALVALLARPAASSVSFPEVHPEPNGDTVRWRGESASLAIAVDLVDPARTLLELELLVADLQVPLVVHVNDQPAASVDAGAAARTIAFRRQLRPGRNRIVLAAGGGERLRSVDLRVATTPVPDCAAMSCDAPLAAALKRAERLAREHKAAPDNLYEAWRWFGRARGYAVGIGDDEVIARIETQLRGAAAALDEKCSALQFVAARHLALDDIDGARQAARDLLETFPGDEHACRASGEDLLRALEDGGG